MLPLNRMTPHLATIAQTLIDDILPCIEDARTAHCEHDLRMAIDAMREKCDAADSALDEYAPRDEYDYVIGLPIQNNRSSHD